MNQREKLKHYEKIKILFEKYCGGLEEYINDYVAGRTPLHLKNEEQSNEIHRLKYDLSLAAQSVLELTETVETLKDEKRELKSIISKLREK